MTQDEMDVIAQRVTRAIPINPILGGTPVNRRMDVVINPNDMYCCPNGHLQYNLTEEELEEQKQRDMEPPARVYDGAKCRNCDERVTLLTTDVKQLQQKLGTQMMIVAQLNGCMQGFVDANNDINKIALFLRENYPYEIADGKPWHAGSASVAVIHYLKIERSRFRVLAGRVWRALLKLIGA